MCQKSHFNQAEIYFVFIQFSENSCQDQNQNRTNQPTIQFSALQSSPPLLHKLLHVFITVSAGEALRSHTEHCDQEPGSCLTQHIKCAKQAGFSGMNGQLNEWLSEVQPSSQANILSCGLSPNATPVSKSAGPAETRLARSRRSKQEKAGQGIST